MFLSNFNPIYFALFLFVLLVILFYYVEHVLPKRNLKRVKVKVNEFLKAEYIHAKVIDPHKKSYDFLFQIDETKYFIRVLSLPMSGELVCFNKTSWQIHYGGGKRPGKTFTKKKPIPELNSFILFDPKIESGKYKKILIVYPDAHNLLQWVNESEMIILEPKTNVHGIKVVTFQKFFESFKIL
jgi:hypothetical protein